MKRKGAIVAIVAILMTAIVVTAVGGVTRYGIADTGDLLSYPRVILADERQEEQQLFAILLPGTECVLIMRPLTESEYGSFQVQAISYQIIEQEMLAAAIVMPVVTPTDVATFSSDLVTFLQQQVNAISGFDAFNVMPPDDH